MKDQCYYVDMIKNFNTLNKCNAQLPDSCIEGMELMKAMSDQTRQEIMTIFYTQKEVCVTDIASHFTLSRPTISHHLNLMKRAKLLNTRKDGKEVYYSLNKDYVVTVLTDIVELIKKCC